MKALKVLIFLVLTACLSEAQERATEGQKYADQGFRPPLDIPLRLSGSFGELRSNHFHSGIDFKTQGRTGIPLKAIKKGYVARIKVSPTGFGKALYINHPNGYTSVYAHIERFHESIERFVKQIQYEQKAYDVQIYPNKNEFQFEQGEVIAYSGNSGNSRGPHLHFEIRDTQTEEPINPLFFGFDIIDNRSPRIKGVQLYPKGPNSKVKVDFSNTSKSPVTSKAEPVELAVTKGPDHYVLSGVEGIRASGKIGIGVEAYDYHEGSGSPMGLYKVTLRDAGKLLYQSTIDRFPFYKTRYINAHIDYETKQKKGAKYQRCFMLPGNHLDFYETFNKGYARVSGEHKPELSLIAEDTYGNESRLALGQINHLKAENLSNSAETKANAVQELFPYNRANTFTKAGIHLDFPVNAFYDTVHFRFGIDSAKHHGSLSPVYQVHHPYTPVHKYYEMAIKGDEVPKSLRDKALIVHRDEDGDVESEGGEWENGYVATETRSLGRFFLKVDTVKPEIIPLNAKDGRQFSQGATMQIKIKDELAGIDSYTPQIDGKWARMAYDKKNDLLRYRDFGDLAPGTHELKLSVTDEKGNKAVYHVEFIKN